MPWLGHGAHWLGPCRPLAFVVEFLNIEDANGSGNYKSSRELTTAFRADVVFKRSAILERERVVSSAIDTDDATLLQNAELHV